MRNPHTCQVNQDWGERVPTVHFVLDQDRLRLIGLTPSDAGEQLQFLLTGVPVTQVREDIRTVDVVARASGPERLDPARLSDLTLTSQDGRPDPAQPDRQDRGPRGRSDPETPRPHAYDHGAERYRWKVSSRRRFPWRSAKRWRR